MTTSNENTPLTSEELRQKIEARSYEMGISYTFSQYIEQMEAYLLELEDRVRTLEKKAGIP